MDKEIFRKKKVIVGYLTLIGLILIFMGSIFGYMNGSYLVLVVFGSFFMVAGSIKVLIIENQLLKEEERGLNG